MRTIEFVKMQGAGNDFIVIDAIAGLDYVTFAQKVCDRNMGVGADGVLVWDTSEVADHKMRIINADGSEAEMCGNGARCMAAYIAGKFALLPELFTMETLAGSIKAKVEEDAISVQLSDPQDLRSDLKLKIGDQTLDAHYIDTGVPHVVVFVHGLSEFNVDGLGRIVRNHPYLAPRGANVNFVEQLKDGFISLRTYERGVEGETLACGTGSVASALIGYLHSRKKLAPQKGASIRVLTKSGEVLDVTFDLDVKEDKPVIANVWLKGSGKVICRGEYYYPEG